MASIVHNILLFRFQSDARNFLHILTVVYLPEFSDYFPNDRNVELKYRLLHRFYSSFLYFIAEICLVVNDFRFPITSGQGLLHHFCAASHPWVCPHPELREGGSLQQLHPRPGPVHLPSGGIAQVSGCSVGQKTAYEVTKGEWSRNSLPFSFNNLSLKLLSWWRVSSSDFYQSRERVIVTNY